MAFISHIQVTFRVQSIAHLYVGVERLNSGISNTFYKGFCNIYSLTNEPFINQVESPESVHDVLGMFNLPQCETT